MNAISVNNINRAYGIVRFDSCHAPFAAASVRAMQTYLEDDLRIDFSAVEHWDTEIVRQCAEAGKKKGRVGDVVEVFSTQMTQI